MNCRPFFENAGAYATVIFALSACGPMNPKPGTAESSSSKTALSAGVQGEAIANGTSDKFVFSVKPEAEAAKPITGQNQYVIRLVHASDLSPISKETQVSIDYSHSHAKIPATFNAAISQQEDGSYLATVYFEKPGTWKLNIHVTEPGTGSAAQLQDEYSISISL